jgi:hypothetical protein
VWAVGELTPFTTTPSQTVLHYDGSTWTPLTLPVYANWVKLWGFASNDIWLVGNDRGGVVAHWDGTSWQFSRTGFPYLLGVWGPNPDEIWVFGQRGSLLRHVSVAAR